VSRRKQDAARECRQDRCGCVMRFETSVH
jgi:hypothetical protein